MKICVQCGTKTKADVCPECFATELEPAPEELDSGSAPTQLAGPGQPPADMAPPAPTQIAGPGQPAGGVATPAPTVLAQPGVAGSSGYPSSPMPGTYPSVPPGQVNSIPPTMMGGQFVQQPVMLVQAAEGQPNRKSSGMVVLIVVALAAVLVAAVAVGMLVFGDDSGNSEQAQAGPAEQTVASPTTTTESTSPSATPTPTPTPTVDPEVAAQAELDRMIAESRQTVPLNGQWAAMLAGKWVGINDPLQTNSQGGHVFGAADILAEHEAIRGRVSGVQVVLLDSRTFGQYIDHDGKPLYVTIGRSDAFTSQESVLAWCATQFPEYSGADLENRCTSTRLTP